MASRPVCTIVDCDDPEHYACQVRAKGLQVSPRAQMTRTQNWRPTTFVPPSRNRQIVYDDRPGGLKMPVMKPDGTVVRQKYADEHKHEITNHLRKTRQ